MICDNCGKDTAANLPYCSVCGHTHNLNFEEVQVLAQEQIQKEREASTEEQIRQILMATLFVLLSTWIINGLFQNPKSCWVVSFYSEDYIVPERLVISGGVSYIDVVDKNPAIKRENKDDDK